MNREDIYTSTGAKLFQHTEQLNRYRDGFPYTIIATHISPEGRCNLNCSYCSVTNRSRKERIDIQTIARYIYNVKNMGCKAVILTGGGEPTLYPRFHDVAGTIMNIGMDCALITNGTTINKLKLYRIPFSWVRISVNNSPLWIKKFFEIKDKFLPETTVGLSFIYSGKNKRISPSDLSRYADNIDAKYVRILPDCMQDDTKIDEGYSQIDEWIDGYDDQRFFIQRKKKGAPKSKICHQSYFRPYLSELGGGTVFPCDSIPLNNDTGKFDLKYKLCHPDEIYKFFRKEIIQQFNAKKDCKGCVFTGNVNLIDKYLKDGHNVCMVDKVEHENFI